jgi:hypothetical protein
MEFNHVKSIKKSMITTQKVILDILTMDLPESFHNFMPSKPLKSQKINFCHLDLAEKITDI